MAGKSRVPGPSASVFPAQLEVCLASLPGASARTGAPGPTTGNHLVFIDPEGLRVGGTAVPRPRPVARIVSQDQNRSDPAWLRVHEPLDALDVLYHVVGPDVLRTLAQQLETLPVHIARPRGRQVLQLQRQVLTQIRPRDEQIQPHSRLGPGFQPDTN